MNRVAVTMLVVAGLVGPASAADFVLQGKGGWGQAQIDAVQAAGGTVRFGHDGTGLGVAESANPSFVAAAMKSGAFVSVDPDMMVEWTPKVRTMDLDESAITPGNDRYFPVQWAPQAIGAPAAWQAGCTGKGVRVAVLDGGIYNAHPDLAANIDAAASRSFVPGVAWNDDTGTFWHGTHVAGIVAAIDNTTGVVGIAPEATIIGVKVLHGGSGSFGWILTGLLYASTPQAQGGAGADIINMSLGAVFAKNEKGAGPLVAALNKAVNYADRNGVLVVSAAGNDSIDLDHSYNYVAVPAQSGSGIAVAATGPVAWGYGNTDFSRPSSYTNYGVSAIHVSAPGGDFVYPGNEVCVVPTATTPIGVPCWALDMILSTSRGALTGPGGYTWAAGTSMAAPAAAAVAALVKSANPDISLGALKATLAQSADDTGKTGADPYSGKGWVNAAKACTANQ